MDYASLKSTVLDWIARTDISDVVFEGFVTIIEQTLSAELKCLDMEDHRSVVPYIKSRGYSGIELPKDFREARVVSLAGNPLMYIEPQKFLSNPQNKGFTIIGDEMFFGNGLNTSDATADVIYYKRVPHINNSNMENAIIKKYPNLYLFGCLREAYMYISDTAKADLMDTRFERALEEARYDADTAAYSGSVLTPLPEG